MLPRLREHLRQLMFTHLESINGGFERKLVIAPRHTAGKNWFTVFIAENGGRKSFLLRCLAEAARGNRRYTAEKRQSIQLFPPEDLPSRVIAISGTPLDRFPRLGTRDLKAKSRRRTRDDFVYLGPRASNGMAGVAQSERSLVGSLISNRLRIQDRAKLLARAFALVGLAPYVDVTLAAVSSKEKADSDYDPVLYDLRESLEMQQDDESAKLLAAVKEYSSKIPVIHKTLDRLATKDISLRIGVGTASPASRLGLSIAMWELLLRLGQVTVANTKFYKKKTLEPLPGDQLSSGQWGWLGTFGSLVAEIRQGSLILVDEPENSLHPRWQQEFIKELHSIVSAYEDCQVVVATHSPLIASGVSPQWGSIRTLVQPRRAGGFTRSEELPTAYGWSASDVYDGPFGLVSTRAPEFLASANAALKALSVREPIESDQRDAWISEFRRSLEALPALDSMRDVLENIVERLDGSSKSRASGRTASE